MIVLDTNVISETFRPRPDPAVISWLKLQQGTQLCTTTVTLAEILYGIHIMPPGKRRTEFENMATAYFEVELPGFLLPFDEGAARIYGDLLGAKKRKGMPMSQGDAQIAAIARYHGATIATRNIDDFKACGVELINPWTASSGRT